VYHARGHFEEAIEKGFSKMSGASWITLFLFAPNMNNCTKVLLIVDTEEILSSEIALHHC
jgi:hypothetical protein